MEETEIENIAEEISIKEDIKDRGEPWEYKGLDSFELELEHVGCDFCGFCPNWRRLEPIDFEREDVIKAVREDKGFVYSSSGVST